MFNATIDPNLLRPQPSTWAQIVAQRPASPRYPPQAMADATLIEGPQRHRARIPHIQGPSVHTATPRTSAPTTQDIHFRSYAQAAQLTSSGGGTGPAKSYNIAPELQTSHSRPRSQYGHRHAYQSGDAQAYRMGETLSPQHAESRFRNQTHSFTARSLRLSTENMSHLAAGDLNGLVQPEHIDNPRDVHSHVLRTYRSAHRQPMSRSSSSYSSMPMSPATPSIASSTSHRSSRRTGDALYDPILPYHCDCGRTFPDSQALR